MSHLRTETNPEEMIKMNKEERQKEREAMYEKARKYIVQNLSGADDMMVPLPTKTWMADDLKKQNIKIGKAKLNEIYISNLANYYVGVNIPQINKMLKRYSDLNKQLFADETKKLDKNKKIEAHQVTVYGIIVEGDHYSWPPIEFDFYIPANISLTQIQSMIRDALPRGSRFVNHLAPSGKEYEMTVMFAGRSIMVPKNYILNEDNLGKHIDTNIHAIRWNMHQTHHTEGEKKIVRRGNIKPLYESEWREEYGEE